MACGAVTSERQHCRGVNALAMVQAWSAVRSGVQPELTGAGADAHDFLYVGDAAAGAVAAMTAGRTGDV